jgi:hypothetical protein
MAAQSKLSSLVDEHLVSSIIAEFVLRVVEPTYAISIGAMGQLFELNRIRVFLRVPDCCRGIPYQRVIAPDQCKGREDQNT